MGDLLTYSLSDFLLFSPETYYRLFELHNAAIWPAQLVTIALGLAILALLHRPGVRQGRIISGLLAACWLWVAYAFHLERYATINWAASYFAAAFAVQALLLAWSGVARGRLVFQVGEGPVGRAGLALFLVALVAQPLVGPLAGRAWAGIELFGATPDPTAVATLGLLLTTTDRVPWELLVVPLLWCAVGGATLWVMEAPDALIMLLAAPACLALAAWKTILSPYRQANLPLHPHR
jgi:hypothetical protein